MPDDRQHASMADGQAPRRQTRSKKMTPIWWTVFVSEIVAIVALVGSSAFIWRKETKKWLNHLWEFWSKKQESMNSLFLTLVAVFGIPFLIVREVTSHRSSMA